MKPVPGLCDRCGQRYPLYKLHYEYLLGRSTGVRVCPKCIDPSHPQLDTRGVRTDDKQSVPNSRSDIVDFPQERALYAFTPWVGLAATSTATTSIGIVKVVIQ
jgi:hypothetical protein